MKLSDFSQEYELAKLEAMRAGKPAWKQHLCGVGAIAMFRRRMNDQIYWKVCRVCGKLNLYRYKKCHRCGSRDLYTIRRIKYCSDTMHTWESNEDMEEKILTRMQIEQIKLLLTPREKQLFEYRLQGHTRTQIMRLLEIHHSRYTEILYNLRQKIKKYMEEGT